MACDAMTGQDAVIQARAFMKEVDTTGFVLTKIDGDARGGAALSITAVTGRPVFFAGTGERPEDLEPFYPDRMASRIMGMGDVLSLIDKAQENLDQEKAAETAEKMLSARFTLEDFLVQMQELRKLGPLQDLLAMLPSVPGGKNALKDLEVDDGELGRAEAIIQSMTREERQNPAIIGGSRRSRIARGSGVTTADVNALLKEFEQAKKMMRSMMGGKRMPRVPGMPNLPRYRLGVHHMSVRIRLKRLGAKKRPFYRVVVADQRSPRDGRFIENIGRYQPLDDPSLIEIDEERALHWLRVGAQPSNTVRVLMTKVGIWDRFTSEKSEKKDAKSAKAS